jgi:octaprenyl-diphosphate synthase
MEAIDFEQHVDLITEVIESVDYEMQQAVCKGEQHFAEIGESILKAGGKRLRPALLVFSAGLFGYQGRAAAQLGAALELLHAASLLHDDVIDDAETRRGKPALHHVWGQKQTILAGDYLLSRACGLIGENGDSEILVIFSRMLGELAEGELLEVRSSFDLEVVEDRYFSVIDKKTAQMISAVCEIGAVIGGATRDERVRVSDFGRELGLAFQLRDDSLDYSADGDTLGKDVGQDLREGKITYPILTALRLGTQAERRLIRDCFEQARSLHERDERGEPVDSAWRGRFDAIAAGVREVVASRGGLAATDRLAQEHASRAIKTIAPFADCESKRALMAAARFAVERNH